MEAHNDYTDHLDQWPRARYQFVLGKLRRICNINHCPRVHHAKGLCRYHYNRYGDALPSKPRHKACVVEGCEKKVVALGYCDKHYKRWQRHGDPTVVLKRGRKPKSGSLERPEPTLVDAGSNGEVPPESPDPALFRALSDSAPRPGT